MEVRGVRTVNLTLLHSSPGSPHDLFIDQPPTTSSVVPHLPTTLAILNSQPLFLCNGTTLLFVFESDYHFHQQIMGFSHFRVQFILSKLNLKTISMISAPFEGFFSLIFTNKPPSDVFPQCSVFRGSGIVELCVPIPCQT